MTNKIQFIDLAAQQATIKEKIDKRIQLVLSHGQYIMGPEVSELEQALCDFTEANYCVSCSSGTDALLMALMSLNLNHGEGVLLPSFTFASTAEVVTLLGAVPIFCDIEASTFNIKFDSLKRAYYKAVKEGIKVAGIIAVDMFGLPADYEKINHFSQANNIWVVSDSAQGFGSIQNGKRSGNMAQITGTSFFPAKPLGCYGDGGAVFTNNSEWAHKLKSIRAHGKGKDKYSYERVGINGRLDTLQAAILLEKLAIFSEELERRQNIAKRYTDRLEPSIITPTIPDNNYSAWAQYTIVIPHSHNRQRLQNILKEQGIPTVVYYPNPLHMQNAYQNSLADPDGLVNTESISRQVLSLPMHPYLEESVQDNIVQSINNYFSSY